AAPFFHFEPGRLVEVDRARANERSAVIVNDVFLIRVDEAESSAERKARPIGGGAHHVAAGQIDTERITPAAATAFGVSVGGGAHFVQALTGNGGNDRLRLSRATHEQTDDSPCDCKVKAS